MRTLQTIDNEEYIIIRWLKMEWVSYPKQFIQSDIEEIWTNQVNNGFTTVKSYLRDK